MRFLHLIFGFLRWDFTLYFAEPGGDPPPAPWHEGVEWPEGYTPSDHVKEITNIGDLAKSYDNAREKIVAKGILKPGENASEEEVAVFKQTLRSELGIVAPEKPEDYTWKPPEDLEGQKDVFSEQLKGYHEMGLDDQTVSAIMDKNIEGVRQINNLIQASQVDIAKATETALTVKWGTEYPDRMAAVNKLQEKFPGAMDMLTGVGLANAQPIIEMMDEVARSVTEEQPIGEEQRMTIGEEIAQIKKSDAWKNGKHPDHAAARAKIHNLTKLLVQ